MGAGIGAGIITTLLIIAFVYPAWPGRGVMLRVLLVVAGYSELGGSHRAEGIQARVRWPVWFLQEAELDCWMTVQDVLQKEPIFRTPYEGDVARVRAGRFEWAAVHKNQGEERILFTLPPASSTAHAIQRPTGHSYLLCLYLSWKGIPVYRGRFIVSAFGEGIGLSDFKVMKHP